MRASTSVARLVDFKRRYYIPRRPPSTLRPKDKIKMKSLLVRRKHVNLNDALTAMSDPTIPRRDAVIMWRKALRRANAPTKELIRVAKLHPRKP